MSCPICLAPGSCRCAENAATESTQLRKSAPVPDGAEQYDPTEERFAASLDGFASPPAPIASIEEERQAGSARQTQGPVKASEQADSIGAREPLRFSDFDISGRAERLAQLRPARRTIVLGEPTTVERTLEPGEWKQEVLSRVTRYRARQRPRAERLRSLNLNFESVTPFPLRPLPVDKRLEAAAAPVGELAEQAAEPVEQIAAITAVPESLGEPSATIEQQAVMAMQVDAFGVQRCWPNLAPCNPNPFWKRGTEVVGSPVGREVDTGSSQLLGAPFAAETSAPEISDRVIQDAEPSEITAEQLNAEIIAKLGEAICAAEQRDEAAVAESAVEPAPVSPLELAEPVMPASRVFDDEEAELAAHIENTVEASPPIATVDLLPTPAEARVNAEILFLPIAPLRVRAAMQAIDFGVSVAACLVFTVVLMWLGALPIGKPLVFMMAVLIAFFWSLYEYLLLVNAGTTVGMLLTGLQLTGFESRTVSRSRCRARALAMAVSTLAMGVGFAWALLDLDGLSWHDRASGTFLTRRTE